MSDLERIAKWREGFTDYLLKDNADLIPLFTGRIMFFPNEGDEGSLNPALNELDERYATAEQIERMGKTLHDYSAANRV